MIGYLRSSLMQSIFKFWHERTRIALLNVNAQIILVWITFVYHISKSFFRLHGMGMCFIHAIVKQKQTKLLHVGSTIKHYFVWSIYSSNLFNIPRQNGSPVLLVLYYYITILVQKFRHAWLSLKPLQCNIRRRLATFVTQYIKCKSDTSGNQIVFWKWLNCCKGTLATVLQNTVSTPHTSALNDT